MHGFRVGPQATPAGMAEKGTGFAVNALALAAGGEGEQKDEEDRNPAFRLKLSLILFSATRCTPVHACCPELMRQFLLASPSHPGPQKCGRHRAYRSRPVPFSQICPERALALTWQ